MKSSLVRPGMSAMLSLGRKGAVRCTVIRERFAAGTIGAQPFWLVVDRRGTEHVVTARSLSLVPVTDANGALLGHLA